jgi:hypothetical protein
MRLLSPAALSAGLGLALLAAPLAMAQTHQHDAGAPHNVASHQMQTPTHRAAGAASSMHNQMSAKAHMQPRKVSEQHHTVRNTHQTVRNTHQTTMTSHHAAMAPHGSAPYKTK